MKKLYDGSKNPPLDLPILLKTKWGDWGIGTAFKYRKNVFFNFYSLSRALYGEEKSTFIEWTNLPK